jgi:hypothetical protein
MSLTDEQLARIDFLLYECEGDAKRTQKGSEGESTGSGLPAVNDMSFEILYLLDPAQGVCMLEGNISRRVEGIWRSLRLRPGGSIHPLPGP